MKTNVILQGDALEELKKLPDECVDCVMTSPPYYGLRDYNTKGQIGLEKTFEDYFKRLLKITKELKRVLKKSGTMFWNHGDSYYGSGAGTQKNLPEESKSKEVYTMPYLAHKHTQRNKEWIRPSREEYAKGTIKKNCLICGKEFYGKENSQFCSRECLNKKGNEFKSQNRLMPNKCLMMQSYRLAQKMVDDQGWILRNIIIWEKPNAMPSSVKDRFSVNFEPIFFFVKSKKYWFETQYEPYEEKMNRWGGEKLKAQGESTWDKGTGQETYRDRNMRPNPQGRNNRTVWTINLKPFGEGVCLVCGYFDKPKGKQQKKGYFGGEDKSESVCKACGSPLITSHFAVYPEELCETPIRAGTPYKICPKCNKGLTKEEFENAKVL